MQRNEVCVAYKGKGSFCLEHWVHEGEVRSYDGQNIEDPGG